MEPRKFASRGAANFLQRSPLSDLDGSGMRSATQPVPLASRLARRGYVLLRGKIDQATTRFRPPTLRRAMIVGNLLSAQKFFGKEAVMGFLDVYRSSSGTAARRSADAATERS